MVKNKLITIFIIMAMVVAAILCLLATAYSDELTEILGGTAVKMEYETKLFNTDEVIDIDIQMDEDEWDKMLSNAMSEEYYVCDVVVNGMKVREVAIRPKGNTSLSAIAMDPDTDRYSLKLEFDHFVNGQTCYGLDKLILNNNYADATNMKEAVIYDMYQYIGADASLYNYAKVSVNGEYWGVYLALEGVEDSFMLRNYGTQDGELYKPDTMEMGGGESKTGSKSGFSAPSKPGENSEEKTENGFNFDPNSMPDMGNFDPNNMPDMGNFEPSSMSDMGNFDPSNMPDMSNFNPGGDQNSNESESNKNAGGGNRPEMGGFSMGGSGANLNYSDEDLDSYSTIWEGEITETSKGDHRKVVTALKNISEGNNLEKYLDIDNVLKYMAVHTFAVNMDSLSGSMSHNYYLYEYEGMLNIFPWDYNLSLGGMSMGNSANATEVVNDAIDTPFSGTKFFDALLENEEYLEKYHEYLQMLTDEYVNGGRFDEVYSRIRSQIDTLVAEDPTAFYTAEEYTKAVEILYEVIGLRAESIKGQIEGTIPSTDSEQKKDSSALIDASHINLKDMGEFNMGGSFGNKSEDKSETKSEDKSEEKEGSDSEENLEAKSDEKERFQFSGMPDNSDMKNMPDMSEMSNMPGRPDMSGMPNMPGMPEMSSGIGSLKNLLAYGICFVLMIITLLIVKRIKRRR